MSIYSDVFMYSKLTCSRVYFAYPSISWSSVDLFSQKLSIWPLTSIAYCPHSSVVAMALMGLTGASEKPIRAAAVSRRDIAQQQVLYYPAIPLPWLILRRVVQMQAAGISTVSGYTFAIGINGVAEQGASISKQQPAIPVPHAPIRGVLCRRCRFRH